MSDGDIPPEVQALVEALRLELADATKQADSDLALQDAMEVAMDYPMARKMTPAMIRADRIRAVLTAWENRNG